MKYGSLLIEKLFSFFPFWTLSLGLSTYFYGFTGIFILLTLWTIHIAINLVFLHEQPIPPNNVSVCIVGAGFSGICMAIKCQKLGIKYVVLESESSPGGTWKNNIYPGCGSDVQANFYSYSFEPNPYWSRLFPTQPEILKYIEHCAKKYNVNIMYCKRLKAAVWNHQRKSYDLEFHGESGTKMTADILVSCTGALTKPIIPNFPGLEKFAGHSFHSAEWDDSVDIKGKEVAVIGTGASAVQIVPAICNRVKTLNVFQRTPTWVQPRFDHPNPYFLQFFYAHVPGALYTMRILSFLARELLYFCVYSTNSAMNHLISEFGKLYCHFLVKDRSLADKLIPNYSLGCKRITPSDDYLQAFNRANVNLITSKIELIEETGILTQDGNLHQADIIVFATGFSTLKSYVNAFEVRNEYGKTMAEIFGNEPESFLGIAYPELTNFFTLVGPNTYSAYTSIIWNAECQVNYIAECIRIMVEQKYKTIRVTEKATKRFQDLVQAYMESRSYFSGCLSWYKGDTGMGKKFHFMA